MLQPFFWHELVWLHWLGELSAGMDAKADPVPGIEARLADPSLIFPLVLWNRQT